MLEEGPLRVRVPVEAEPRGVGAEQPPHVPGQQQEVAYTVPVRSGKTMKMDERTALVGSIHHGGVTNHIWLERLGGIECKKGTPTSAPAGHPEVGPGRGASPSHQEGDKADNAPTAFASSPAAARVSIHLQSTKFAPIFSIYQFGAKIKSETELRGKHSQEDIQRRGMDGVLITPPPVKLTGKMNDRSRLTSMKLLSKVRQQPRTGPSIHSSFRRRRPTSRFIFF